MTKPIDIIYYSIGKFVLLKFFLRFVLSKFAKQSRKE